MSQAVICQGVTAAQAPPGTSQSAQPGGNLPQGSQAADFHTAGAGTPVASPGNATWHAILTATQPGANVSGTFTPLVSNDGINWLGAGIASIVIASGPSPQQGQTTTGGNWAFYSGYWSALGAGSVGKCVFNA